MKKMKMAALVLALALIVSVFAGCGAVKWDDLNKKDVVATVNGKEITKQHVLYQYAQDQVSQDISAQLMSQLGVSGEEEELEMEDSFAAELTKYILGELARENGYGITEEDAYDKAYNDLVLSAKKNGYDYLEEYNQQVMDMLYFDQDMMLEYAWQDIYNSTPVYNYVHALMEEMQDDYPDETDPDEEQLQAAVVERLTADAKNVTVELNYHKKSILNKLTIEKTVSNAALSFQRTTEE